MVEDSSVRSNIKKNLPFLLSVGGIFVAATFAVFITQNSKNPKLTTNKAAEIVNQQLAAVASSYCTNPDTSADRFVAIGGNDSNTCTFSSPCATIPGAVSKVANLSPRPRIFVRGGIYSSRVVLGSYSGTATSPIIICGKYNDEQATFQEAQTSPTPDGSAFILIYKPYYVFSDFVVIGNGKNIDNSSGHGASGIMATNDTGAWTGNQGHHVIIINNTVKDFWHDGITTPGNGNGGGYSQILNNEITNTVLENFPKDRNTSGWGSAIGLYKGNYNLVKGNHVYRNWGEGIGLSNGASNNTIASNNVHDNYSIQIYIDSANNNVVEKNFSYFANSTDTTYKRCTSGECKAGSALGIAGETGPNDGNIVRNNILANTQANIDIFNGGTASYITNAKIYNNTLYNSTYAWQGNLSITIFSDTTTNEFRNNIIMQPAGNTYPLINPEFPSTNNGFIFSNNLWYRGSGSIGRTIVGTGDILLNPMLLNPDSTTYVAENYSIQSTSAAIDHGIALAVVDDYLGTNRPVGTAFDIGAFEFNNGITPAPTNLPSPTISIAPTTTTAPTNTVAPTAALTPTPTLIPDTTIPSVSITRPTTNGGTYRIPSGASRVQFTGSASDVSGIYKIEILIDNAIIQTCYSSSCSNNYQAKRISTGTHTVTFRATDNSSNRNVGSASITVIK